MAAVLPFDPGTSGGAAPRKAGSTPRTKARADLSFGKYREIIIAVAFFLLFDLGVLVLNFYTSFKIDQDTVAINLAGRQRYVSQRIARTLLELDAARIAGQPYRPDTLAPATKVWPWAWSAPATSERRCPFWSPPRLPSAMVGKPSTASRRPQCCCPWEP
jgi:hypothetical protein